MGRAAQLHGWWRRCGGFVLKLVHHWPGGPPLPLVHGASRALLRATVERIAGEVPARVARSSAP